MHTLRPLHSKWLQYDTLLEWFVLIFDIVTTQSWGQRGGGGGGVPCRDGGVQCRGGVLDRETLGLARLCHESSALTLKTPKHPNVLPGVRAGDLCIKRSLQITLAICSWLTWQSYQCWAFHTLRPADLAWQPGAPNYLQVVPHLVIWIFAMLRRSCALPNLDASQMSMPPADPRDLDSQEWPSNLWRKHCRQMPAMGIWCRLM